MLSCGSTADMELVDRTEKLDRRVFADLLQRRLDTLAQSAR